jgi:hypothetical protein
LFFLPEKKKNNFVLPLSLLLSSVSFILIDGKQAFEKETNNWFPGSSSLLTLLETNQESRGK